METHTFLRSNAVRDRQSFYTHKKICHFYYKQLCTSKVVDIVRADKSKFISLLHWWWKIPGTNFILNLNRHNNIPKHVVKTLVEH